MSIKKATILMCILGVITLLVIGISTITLMKHCNKEDVPLTNEQVMQKATTCDKKGKAIRIIYDDQWVVYAVKCVDRFAESEAKKSK